MKLLKWISGLLQSWMNKALRYYHYAIIKTEKFIKDGLLNKIWQYIIIKV